MKESEKMIVGNHYNWKNQPEHLVYIGRDGLWFQFSLVDSVGVIWCEVLESDLHMLEETKQ